MTQTQPPHPSATVSENTGGNTVLVNLFSVVMSWHADIAWRWTCILGVTLPPGFESSVLSLFYFFFYFIFIKVFRCFKQLKNNKANRQTEKTENPEDRLLIQGWQVCDHSHRRWVTSQRIWSPPLSTLYIAQPVVWRRSCFPCIVFH